MKTGQILLGLTLLAMGAGPLNAADEPYLAIRTGLKCSACHTNRTGGGGRNAFGSAWGQTQLPIKTFDVRNRNLTDWLAIGFDVRARFGAAVQTTQPQTEFDIPEAQVQLEGQLIPGVLTLYVDQTVGPEQSRTREAFGMVSWKPASGYAKAGKMLLPFGWRLWDDNAFIRSETGFTYGTPDIGVEVGIEPGPLSWSVALTNGTAGGAEGDNGKMITTQAIFTYPAFRIGVSASRNDLPATTRDVFGGLGGVKLGPLALLGEADWIKEDGVTQRDQFVGYVEGNLLAHRGVNAKVSYGYHDPNLDVSDDELVRMRFGVEVFPITALQVSGFYEFRDAPPASAFNIDRILLELHVHF